MRQYFQNIHNKLQVLQQSICGGSVFQLPKSLFEKNITLMSDSPQLGHCNPKIRLPDTQRARCLNINSWKTVSFHGFIKEQNLLFLVRT